MKMMPSDIISHENQLQHLSEPSIFILDVFRTADHAGQIFIPHRLGRRPVTQGPRNQSSNQGWTEKLATERKIRVSKDILSVGTWNVRTLWATGKLQLLQEEMRRLVWCINTRTIPRCFGETKMASNNENGIGHLRALVPWLMMMMI